MRHLSLIASRLLCAALALALAASPGVAANEEGRAPSPPKHVPQTQAQITLSFAPVVKQTAPAVVNIYTRKVVERQLSPFASDPFFEDFFGDFFSRNLPTRRRVENSLGSGVIIDSSGIVVSNHHVVGGADEITVVLSDRREFDGRVIFADQDSDLAVVELEDAADLPVLTLRDSDTIEVGDLVLAIGNPFGVGQTVTSGIVSGVARSPSMGQGYFIQTDAAINPGNSGGALVDMQGRLIGVNTQILSRSGGSIGIGFAVPANLVARVIEAALSGETGLARPWLGFDGQPVTSELADALGIDGPRRGVLIDQMHPVSPLQQAGLEPGDVLVGLAGDTIDSPAELSFRIATLGTGKRADLTYLRDGAEKTVTVPLTAAPETPPRDELRLEKGPLAGLALVSINPAVIVEGGLPLTAEGVLVTRSRGQARRQGLRRGDIVIGARGESIKTTKDFRSQLGETTPLDLEVIRGKRRGLVRVGRQ